MFICIVLRLKLTLRESVYTYTEFSSQNEQEYSEDVR